MTTKTKYQLEIDFGKTLIVDGPRIGVAVSGEVTLWPCYIWFVRGQKIIIRL